MKVAIYARVSREDLNIDNQLNELREYCERKKYIVYKEYIDVDSGTKEDRPGLKDMMNDAFQKRFDAVAVWKIDRLGRSLNQLLYIVNRLKDLDVDFISTTQLFDTTNPQGKLIFHIFGAMAELERDLIIERTRAGLKRARERGIKLGRPKGSKDKKARRKAGYYLRYQKKGMYK